MINKQDFKEECWILYGVRLFTYYGILFFGFQKYHTIGTSGGVEMDYETSNDPKVIGWYHTHPGIKNVTPSSIDNSTMRSWVKAVYKPYLCGIRCGIREACYCYYVNGVNKDKVTIVSKKSMSIKFLGSFFIGRVVLK